MLSVLMSVMLISSGNLEVLPADYIQSVENIEINEVSTGLYEVTASEFGSSENEILLPQKTILLPVPSDVDVSVQVIPRNISSLGAVPEIARVLMDENNVEYFVNSERAALNAVWGGSTITGSFRRAGFVMVELNPVIVQNGELLAAGSLEVRLSYNRSVSSSSQTVTGREGEIFQSVFGTNEVWRTPLQSRASSPFWGKPWAEIKVDTAGVFEITADLIPEAIGMPSNSFSMITGRGRNISFDNPVEDAFVPRGVSVFVDDGNDGTFDSSDRILFYGRGLSWWGEFQSDHFNGMYDSLNTYWLTWGGAGGPFMESIDGSVTGAPSAGSSYVNRLHFEINSVLSYGLNSIDDMFGWHRISAIGSTTANYSFTSPGTTGEGTVRFNCSIESGSNLLFRATVNGSVMSDTILSASADQTWEFPVSGLKSSGNSLAVYIQDQSVSRSAFVVYSNWIEVFPETGFKSWSTHCEVPLSREQFPVGERRLVSWGQNLDSESFVCVALGDTASVIVDVPGGKDFEIDLPEGWQEAVMWVLPNGNFREPVSVTNSNPGRIIGTLSEANTVYLYPEEYSTDMPLFVRGRSSTDALFIGLDEIYNEFNGGVRDPNAVRVFVDYAINTWQKAPTEIVLVGTGYFDPRGFTTAKISLVDVIVYTFYKGLPVCSDFLYSVVDVIPEMAVSRIAVDSRTELQLVAQRSLEYSDISQESGIWQSVILGAADDERVPDGTGVQAMHTRDTETMFTDFVPDRFIPNRHYLIEYDWNSNWKKPEARVDYIDKWSSGALISFFLGHGGYDQIVDEGLLYIEDVNLLACGPRLPYAFFGSCNVGTFQNPSYSCMAQKITVAENGGAIVSSAASSIAFASYNANFLSEILTMLFTEPGYSIAENQWLALLIAGFSGNNQSYIIFGDGSLHLALPGSKISVDEPVMRTSELCEIDGALTDDGLVMLTAWASAAPDSYYTIQNSYLIEYLSTPGEFYRGVAPASPEFSADMFVPSIAQTGALGRVRYFAPGIDGGTLTCSYPVEITAGIASSDTTGPVIEMWLTGFQGTVNPTVSGDLIFEAALEDSSGINLLSYPGTQLALYIDDNPVDLAENFTYKPGSATSGTIVYSLPELQPGDHMLKLRAADNVMNLSFEESTFHYIENTAPEIDQLFVYPTPASSVLSFNWMQSMAGSVSLSIYTVAGRRVISFGNITSEAGYNQFVWNLLDAEEEPVAAGTYVFVISSGDSELTGVATIVR